MKRNVRKEKRFFGSSMFAKAALLLPLIPAAVSAASVTLEWRPSTAADVAGYRVHYRADEAAVPFAAGTPLVDAAKSTTATINGLDPGNSYYLAVTAYNSAGEESFYSNVVSVQESIPPSVVLTSPKAGSSVTGAVSVAATASDNRAVTRVDFFVNGELEYSDQAAPYGFDWNTLPLSTGSYTITAKAFDAAGNVAASELQVAVGGDITPPEVGISGAAENGYLAGNVTLAVSASDNVGVTRLELYDNGTLVLAANEAAATYAWDTLVAGNGTHQLIARAYDAAGNAGSASLTVNVLNDLSAPAVTIVSPVDGASVGSSVGVLVGASDDIGVSRVEFYLDGVLQESDSSVPYSFQWNTASSGNGIHVLSARAYDAAGHEGRSPELRVAVFNDVTPPVVSLVSPGTVDAAATLSVSASDDVAATRTEIYLNGSLLSGADGASQNYTWNTSTLADGNYVLSAKGYDAAGNVGLSSSVTVTVSHPVAASQLPLVTVAAPTSSDIYTPSVRVTASSKSVVPILKMEIYIDGVRRSGTYTNYINYDLPITVGNHTLVIKALDAANSVGSYTSTITRLY